MSIKTYAATAVVSSLLWTNEALANCGLPLPGSPACPPGGGAAPEIDGSAGIAAMALVASLAAIFYNRSRR